MVQPVGHLTVNEDGGGSNPPAPANFPRKLAIDARRQNTIRRTARQFSESVVYPDNTMLTRKRASVENGSEYLGSNPALPADSQLERGQTGLEQIPCDLFGDLFHVFLCVIYARSQFISVDR